MTSVQHATRRLFFSHPNPKAMLDELVGPQGLFVPTRAAFHLGERAVLALQRPGDDDAVEVPIVIVGRRSPAGAAGALSQGVVARVGDPTDPRVARARSALTAEPGVDEPGGIGRKERLFFARYLRRHGR